MAFTQRSRLFEGECLVLTASETVTVANAKRYRYSVRALGINFLKILTTAHTMMYMRYPGHSIPRRSLILLLMFIMLIHF